MVSRDHAFYWVKFVFPFLQVLVLPLNVYHGLAAVEDSVSNPNSPGLFRKLVECISMELPRMRILAFVVTSTKFDVSVEVIAGVKK